MIKSRLAELAKIFPTPNVVDQARRLVVIAEYLKLLDQFHRNPRIKRKAKKAAEIACRNVGKDTLHFQRKIRSQARYLQKYGVVPSTHRGNFTSHASLLDNEAVRIKIREHLATLPSGEITPRKFRAHLIEVILPSVNSDILDKSPSKSTISMRTAERWLRKLGYSRHAVKKGVYVDGHERPDVRLARDKFLRSIEELQW